MLKNKFKRLCTKLIGSNLWSSDISLIQLEKSKQGTKVVYTDYLTKDMKCVKTETTKKLNDDKFDFFTEFYVSEESVKDFVLDKNKLVIKYNEKRYSVFDIVFLGTMNNEDALIKLVVKR